MDISEQLETLRKTALKQKNKFFITCVVGIPVFIFIPIPIFAVAVIVLITVMRIKYKKAENEFQYAYKNNFVAGILKNSFSDVRYDWKKGLSEQMVTSMGLVRMGNVFHSEDLICATYDGVYFEQSDVTVIRVVKSNKQTHTYTHFRGRMFSFDHDGGDIRSTMVFSNDFNYRGEGFGVAYNDVHMESVEFNKSFTIKSNRDIDAFYVLTPQMMECITGLEKHLGNIAIHFTPKKVYVAYNTDENAFDADIEKEINYNQETDNRKRDIQVIIDIINALKISK